MYIIMLCVIIYCDYLCCLIYLLTHDLIYCTVICIFFIIRYVEEDLKEGLGKEPAKVLSARPMVREDLSPVPLANANSFVMR